MFAYSVKCGICGFEACIEKEIPLNEAGINAVLEDCCGIGRRRRNEY